MIFLLASQNLKKKLILNHKSLFVSWFLKQIVSAKMNQTFFPAIYHGHFAFIDLDKYSEDKTKNIIQINMIRKPLDRYELSVYFCVKWQKQLLIREVVV
jgi:hypothetical protein